MDMQAYELAELERKSQRPYPASMTEHLHLRDSGVDQNIYPGKNANHSRTTPASVSAERDIVTTKGSPSHSSISGSTSVGYLVPEPSVNLNGDRVTRALART